MVIPSRLRDRNFSLRESKRTEITRNLLTLLPAKGKKENKKKGKGKERNKKARSFNFSMDTMYEE